MKLTDVFNLLQIDTKKINHDSEVKGLTSDSRAVKEGYLFIAIAGFANDGHDYVDEAITNGALAIIGEKSLTITVPYIKVDDTRQVMGVIASEFYSHPSLVHRMIGITGTNGKTTTAYLIHHLIKEAGFSCGMIGTVENKINNQTRKAINTTPDALALQVLLDESTDDFIVIEISSHALHQHRTEGLQLDLAVFTNLTHDHMDYHQTIDDYYEQKKKIFSLLKEEGVGLVNIDDQWGAKIASERMSAKIKTIGEDGDYDLQLILENLKYRLKLTTERSGGVVADSPLPGKHNLMNTSVAIAACMEMGISNAAIMKGLTSFKGVPGRWEMYHNQKGAKFIIDYAHTEDALRYLLQTANENGAKKIVIIFGFRGKRDKSKQVKMVQVAAEYCQLFILTLDDLNGERKSDVEKGLEGFAKKYANGKVMMDRTLAIKKSWNEGEEGDWIFITGKGRESYKEAFSLQTKSDYETIQYLLKCEENDG